jgi:hypothetical protein
MKERADRLAGALCRIGSCLNDPEIWAYDSYIRPQKNPVIQSAAKDLI